MATLYLVATPIGNLEDITLRAVRTLGEVDLIAAEDTRTTGKLLKHLAITTPMVSYHEFSGEAKIDELVGRLDSADIALVTDAGTPTVSDPGFKLIRKAIAAGHIICPIPGANAAITALSSSGLPTDSFLFLGFLPKPVMARQQALADVATLPYTLILYESPNRLVKLMTDILAVLGDRTISVGRELTKLHEEIWRGPVSEALTHFGDGRIRGEITVVIAGASSAKIVWDEDAVRAALAAKLATGASRKEAAAYVAEQSGWRKKQVYNLPLNV